MKLLSLHQDEKYKATVDAMKSGLNFETVNFSKDNFGSFQLQSKHQQCFGHLGLISGARDILDTAPPTDFYAMKRGA